MECKSRIDWSDMDKEAICKYVYMTADAVSGIEYNHDLFICNDVDCADPAHLLAIYQTYVSLVNAQCDASKPFSSAGSTGRRQGIPGWNEYVKEAHCEARDAFLLWQ